MVLKVFDAPVLSDGSWTSWSNAFRFAAADIIAYNYDAHFSEPGRFSVTLPFSDSRLAALTVNSVLWIRDDVYNSNDSLIADDIYYDGKQIVISGKDSKSLLHLRQTLPPAGSDYHKASDTISACCRALLEQNCMPNNNFAVPESRQLPIDMGGTAAMTSTSFMTAYDDLGDVITGMCDSASVGFALDMNFYGNVYITNRYNRFIFSLITGTDRSYAQSVRPRVAFSIKSKNTLSLSFEHDVSNLLTTAYAKDSNGTVQTVHIGSESTGLFRRECSVTVPVPVTDEMFEEYAKNEIRDNIETHTYELTASAASGYGSRYYLGDTVTVRDDFTGGYYNGVITAAEKSFSSCSRSLKLTIGKPKQKLLDKIVKNMKNGVI